MTFADWPIIYLGLSSQLDPIQLTQLAEKTVIPQLERIDGVGSVRVRGGSRREIQVDLDRFKLEALNMGANEVIEALQRENVNQPAGDFDQGNVRMLIRSRGEFRSLKEIADTVVRERNGAIVRVRDVAQVIDGEEEKTELTRVNGKPGMLIYLNKQSGANTIAVSDRVRVAVDRINLSIKKAKLSIRVDKSDFIRNAISNVQSSAMFGMLLAIIVLIVFLRSFRSTMVIAISMPLSVLATFVLIFFKGFTLNIVSFGGLALGIGLLVDNSIVVLESIFRKREEDGIDAKQAAILGTQEVGSAIVASTLTTLIVFLPLLFIGGTTGIMLHQLAWVVSFSLICSLFVSLTLTPVLAAYWIGSSSTQSQNGGSPVRSLAGGVHRLTSGMFSTLEGAYERLLRASLRWSPAVGFAILILFTTTIGLAPRIGTEFLPKPDEGDLRVMANMAPGILLKNLDKQVQLIESVVIKEVPESITTATSIGDGADDSDDWNEAWIRLHLKPRSQRRRNVEEIRKDLAEKIGDVAGTKVRVMVRNEMVIARFLSSRGGDVEVEIRGYDLDTAEELATAVVDVMEQIPGMVNVETEKEDRRPELSAQIDRTKASLLGVRVGDITQTLETAIRGTKATLFRDKGDEFNVLVRLQKSDRQGFADIESVGVTTRSGRVVPLKSFVTFTPDDSPVTVKRRDQQRVVQVSCDVEDRDLGGVVAELQERLAAIPLPEGFTLNIAGDWEEQQRSFTELRKGLILAIVLMYMVMASQFESLRDPLLILVTIPLGAIGVVLILVLTGTTLNVQSFIGVVMLAGIVVNNAIVLVDYINQLRRANPDLNLEDCVVRAATRRFRPILMTTLTTVLAMLPIAMGMGEGGELQAPMARVVIGGLVSSTLTTLLAIPLIYAALDKRRNSSSPDVIHD